MALSANVAMTRLPWQKRSSIQANFFLKTLARHSICFHMAWLSRLSRHLNPGLVPSALQVGVLAHSTSGLEKASCASLSRPTHGLQVRGFGGPRRQGETPTIQSSFAPYPMVPYGVKRSSAYRESKKAARKAAERARRAQEEKGMILDPKKQLRMEIKRNSGIGWYRAAQIIKHLEMHERGKGPPMDQAMRDRITDIARVVRMGR
eukprot:s3090_g4.t2